MSPFQSVVLGFVCYNTLLNNAQNNLCSALLSRVALVYSWQHVTVHSHDIKSQMRDVRIHKQVRIISVYFTFTRMRYEYVLQNNV
jgi:hypothetical protein